MDFGSLDTVSLVFLILGIIFMAVILVFGVFGFIHSLKQKIKRDSEYKKAAGVFFITCPSCGTEVPLGRKRCLKCKAYLSND